MDIVTPELAERLLKSLEAGATAANHTLADLLNEVISYLIFIELMSCLKIAVGIGVLFFVRKAFRLFEEAQPDLDKKNFVRGLSTLASGMVLVVSLSMSWGSLLSLGKVILAPKVYLVEMAYKKLQEVKK